MYAVIQTGGKQYRVQIGDVVEVEKLDGDKGSSLNFNEVLLVANGNAENPQIWLGKPHVSGASVVGEIVAQGRGKKVMIGKFKRRKDYHRLQGHRQELTQVLVTGLNNGAGEQVAMSDTDKKAKLDKIFTLLKPKGPARVNKTQGSRKKMAAAQA